MKNCTHCKHANWQRTAAGRLHPSGHGRCGFIWKLPALPGAFYWLSKPSPMGGTINRKSELSDHCPYYATVGGRTVVVSFNQDASKSAGGL